MNVERQAPNVPVGILIYSESVESTSGSRAAKYFTYSPPIFFTILSRRYKDGSFCSFGT
jgi:hypothetical protein